MTQQSATDHLFMQHFPRGFKLLLVGIDKDTQRSIAQCLPRDRYQITTSPNALFAFDFLRRERHGSCDLVLSNALLEDYDGYQFIRDQQFNYNIPHIVMCGGQRSNETLTAFKCGACYVLFKPMSESELANLWQHVARMRGQQHMTDFSNNHHIHNHNHNHHKNHGPSSLVASKGKSRSKKPRFEWTEEFQRRFVHALNILGIEDAKPTKILKIMNVRSLTRDHVSSHLQKYRERLKKRKVMDSRQHIPSDQMPQYGQRETSYGRIDTNNYNNEPNISSQPTFVSSHQVSIPHPLHQSPYDTPHPESHNAQISFKMQPHHHHVQMQTPEQNLCFDDVHQMSMAPSFLQGDAQMSSKIQPNDHHMQMQQPNAQDFLFGDLHPMSMTHSSLQDDVQISSKMQLHDHDVQMQQPDEPDSLFGDVDPMSMPHSSLQGDGTDMTFSLQDLNLASASSYGIDMEQHDSQATEVSSEDLGYQSGDSLFANFADENEHPLPKFPPYFFSGIPGFSP